MNRIYSYPSEVSTCAFLKLFMNSLLPYTFIIIQIFGALSVDQFFIFMMDTTILMNVIYEA